MKDEEYIRYNCLLLAIGVCDKGNATEILETAKEFSEFIINKSKAELTIIKGKKHDRT